MSTTTTHADLIARPSDHIGALERIVGPGNVLVGDAIPAHATQDLWGSGRVGRASVVVRPRSALEVAAILRHCDAHNQPVVVQGGMTGLVAGGVPNLDEVILSTELLTSLVVDPKAKTVVAGAGATLGDAQRAAAKSGMVVPIDLASKDSATIGGCVAHNAGGVNVVRYGMTRAHVRSLEVAMADGRLLTLSTPLIKDNAGIDLKQMFIGSEGILGVVTSATISVFPATGGRRAAFCAVAEVADACALLDAVQRATRGAVTAFEVMWAQAYGVLAGVDMRLPLPAHHPLYVLVEVEGGGDDGGDDRFIDCLDNFGDRLLDSAIATSAQDLAILWSARERIPSEVLRRQPLFGFDVSVPAFDLDEALARIEERLRALWPTVELIVFGHLGDDNVHISVLTGESTRDRKPEVEQIVYTVVSEFGGSISAEHGIGYEKREYLRYTRSSDEIAMMRDLKRLFDPRGILNRGRLIPWKESDE